MASNDDNTPYRFFEPAVRRQSHGDFRENFVSRAAIEAANGLAMGDAVPSPGNLAIEADDNTCSVDDQSSGSADRWFAKLSIAMVWPNRSPVGEVCPWWASNRAACASR